LTPPPGWKFAKLADRSIAVSPDGTALLAAAEISSGAEAQMLDSLANLSQASALENVKFEALKKRFKKPQSTIDGQAGKVDLWEISKSTSNGVNPELRDKGTGTVLAFVARLGESRAITGLAFVVVPDAERDAEKVMNALRSLRSKP
jgi:hypothetical protein